VEITGLISDCARREIISVRKACMKTEKRPGSFQQIKLD